MSSDYKFQGWLGLDKNADKGNMVWQEYTPKTFQENDVDIKITHCGICGSDLHTLRSGGNWGESLYPVCVGHEIVGTAVRVGSQVEGGIKVGDRVGVGAQSDSCCKPDCAECSDNKENYCQNHQTTTYNSKHKDGSKSYGGYADYWRGPSHFVFKIPDALPSDIVAPMLCGVRPFLLVIAQKFTNVCYRVLQPFHRLCNTKQAPGSELGLWASVALGISGLWERRV